MDSVTLSADPPSTFISNIVLKSSWNNKSGLKICCFNARSIYPKLDELNHLLDGVEVDVICIAESWLTDKHTNAAISIPGFNILRNDRKSRIGGGVCIYIKSTLKYVDIFKSSTANLEIGLVEIQLLNVKLLLAALYKPPRKDLCDELEQILNDYSLAYSDIILCGDRNYDMLRQSSATNKFKNLLTSFSLKVVNSEPTFFCETRSSLLDLVITNTNKINFLNQISPGFIDHDFLFFNYDIQLDRKSICRSFRDFNHINMESMYVYCASLPWDNILYSTEIDEKIVMFNALILDVLDKCVPIRKVVIKHTKPPWFNNEIEDQIILRDLNSGKEKSKFFSKKLDPKLPAKEFCKNVDRLGLNDVKGCTQPSIFTADELNMHFMGSQTSSGLSDPLSDGRNDAIHSNQFSFRNIDLVELYQAFALAKSNAIGLDAIPIKLIRLLLPLIESYILHIFNYILTTSKFPKAWKIAKIIPIPKISKPSSVDEFRPVNILSALSKVMERIMSIQITEYLNSKSLLNPFQSAYRPLHSTSSALLNIVDDIRRKADNKELTVMVLLDFSKAFDSICHKKLLEKLSIDFEFSSVACNLVQSYLIERFQETHVGDSKSNLSAVINGVPQGSVLGPLFFSIYINDLPRTIKFCSYHLFADDIQIYTSAPKCNIGTCVANLNLDIASINNRAEENKLKLNAAKTQVIVMYSNAIETENFPSVLVKNIVVPYSKCVKNLGLRITCDLSWNDQVQSVRKTVTFILRKLWSLTKCTGIELRRKMILAYVVPHLLYANYAMYGMHEYNVDKMQSVFNACIRYIYKLRKYDHISQYAHTIFGCSLREYLQFRNCSFIHKTLKFNKPAYISSKLVKLTSSRSNNLLVPRNKTYIFNSSFFVRGVSIWNALPLNLKISTSSTAFKANYFKYLETDVSRQ